MHNNNQKNIRKIPNFRLNEEKQEKRAFKELWGSTREFIVFVGTDRFKFLGALVLAAINSASNVLTPYFVALAIDRSIKVGDLSGLPSLLMLLGVIYAVTVVTGYAQARIMGSVSQRTLFRLREALFLKLQELPIAFFAQNKVGDLISRLNNDTDKLNQFLSESVMRFVGGFFTLSGIAVFTLYAYPKLGLLMLASCGLLFVVTELLSPLLKRENKRSLDAAGELSASLQENLSNFRVIAAYSKRRYFKEHLKKVSDSVFSTAFRSSALNRVFEPVYDFAGAASLIAVIGYGMHLVGVGSITVGLLVAFVSYTQKFYDPLRMLATIFGSVQLSLAAWGRIRTVLKMDNVLVVESHLPESTVRDARLQLSNVSFGYREDEMVIEDINLVLMPGKTYALVGPTGGGKSTLASIMARLYDPLCGDVFLDGKNLKSIPASERSAAIGVILQDPITIGGTVADNLRYGNDALTALSSEELTQTLRAQGFEETLARFEQGLETPVAPLGVGMSIGQKQLISFMRALLRKPKILILDEATANIDTVTEASLGKILSKLPADTTKVIIAHRLNTIKEADEIIFVNGHHTTRAGGLKEALALIESATRTS